MKKIAVSFLVLLLIVVLAIGILFGLSRIRVDSDKYSEKQHIERISKAIEKRFMNKDYGFTGFKAYPLYNENDEMEHCLIEFEPSGFFCIQINKKSSILPWHSGMYFMDSRCQAENYLKDPWQRMRFSDRIDDMVLYPESSWKADEIRDGFKIYEVDENGEPVYRYSSPFKVANVLNEKLYCLQQSISCVFAVKRDNEFFNLETMEKFKEEDYDTTTVISFVYDSIFNL